jgi:hypothetical protein
MAGIKVLSILVMGLMALAINANAEGGDTGLITVTLNLEGQAIEIDNNAFELGLESEDSDFATFAGETDIALFCSQPFNLVASDAIVIPARGHMKSSDHAHWLIDPMQIQLPEQTGFNDMGTSPVTQTYSQGEHFGQIKFQQEVNKHNDYLGSYGYFTLLEITTGVC